MYKVHFAAFTSAFKMRFEIVILDHQIVPDQFLLGQLYGRAKQKHKASLYGWGGYQNTSIL